MRLIYEISSDFEEVQKRHSARTSEMAEGECLLFCAVTVGLHDSYHTHFGTQINIRNPFCHSGSLA